jgi:hypothetical protein
LQNFQTVLRKSLENLEIRLCRFLLPRSRCCKNQTLTIAYYCKWRHN